MKKTILSILVATCAVLGASAQNLTFGVKGGLNLARLSNYDNISNRTSIYAGGFANFAFNDMLSIQPEIEYSGQGVKYNVGSEKITQRLGYINIPVMFHVNLVPEFYLEGGAQFGILAGAHAKSGKVTVDNKDDFKGGDLGMGFGLGYQFPVGVGFSARYMFGLTNISDIRNDKDHMNGVASIGVFYTFNKKFRLK